MFENVLVGVDGRPNGRDAIVLATRLVADGGRLTLAHIHSGTAHLSHTSAAAMDKVEQDAMAILESERAKAEVQAELVSFGARSPGHGLHVLAEQRGADLIVVGSCSRTALGRAMLGDDTRAALNGAPCAVAIAVRGYAEHPMPIATIGVGYDGSPESTHALAVARKVATRNRSLVKALHVVMLPSYAMAGIATPAIGESVDSLLQDAQTEMEELKDVDGRAVYGLPGEELVSFGKDLDLMVVGSRSYGPVRRLMLGSTSNHLERHGLCSLLVLPRTASGGPDPDDRDD